MEEIVPRIRNRIQIKALLGDDLNSGTYGVSIGSKI